MILPYSDNAVCMNSLKMMTGLLLCALAIFGGGQAAVVSHTITPSLYTLELFLDTTKNVFSGELNIDAEVKIGGINYFHLHNHGLEIATVSVVQGGSNLFASLVTNRTMQTSKISTSLGLTAGSKVRISVSYQGNVSTDPTGLFSFVDKGKTIYMTNLYPIYARKLFPCFDEPDLATPISMSLTIPQSNGQLIASSPVTSQTDLNNGYKLYQLATTMPIAPYSFFFTLGDWDGNTGYSLGQSNLKLYLPPSLKSSADLLDSNLILAANCSNIRNLMLLSGSSANIFISPVLASNSYSGLNTVVLKTDISVDNFHETTTAMVKSNLIEVTQAFYRMFYGTWNRPASWGDNWLATSIPMYLSYQILDNIGVYGSSDEMLVNGLYEEVFQSSWSEDSPVPYSSNQLNTPQDIISFITSSGMKKGAYVLKSLETFNNPETIKSSLMGYLVKTNGTVMETEAFINYLNSVLPINIPSPSPGSNLKNIVKPMISEPGYPLIQVSRNQQSLAMLKSSFAIVSSSKGQSYADVTKLKNVANWLVPVSTVTWTSPNTKTPSIYYIDPGTSNTAVSLAGTFPTNGWALLDLEGKGMMRVSYDPISMMLFKSNGLAAFSPAMRAKLIADAFATAESSSDVDGYYWITAISYLEYLDDETELAPWQAALDGFRRMWSWVYETQNNNLTTSFVTYWENRLTKVYTNLTTQGSNGDPRGELRREVVSAMCELGGANCTSDLAAQYQNMVKNGQYPSANMYSVVVCNGVRGMTTVDQWNSVYQNYINSGSWYSQQTLDSHYSFLACPSSSAPINQFLSNVLLSTTAMSFSVDQVVPAVKAIMDRPEHVDKVLSFIVQNQQNLNVTEDMQAEIIEILGQRLSTNAQVKQLQSLNITRKGVSPTLVTAVQKAINAGAQKAAWVSKVQSFVQQALDGAIPTQPPTDPTATSSSPSGTNGTTSTTTPAPSPSPKPGSASMFTTSLFLLVVSFIMLKVAQ